MFGAKKNGEPIVVSIDNSEVDKLVEAIGEIHRDLVTAKADVAKLSARVDAEVELADLRDQIEAAKRERATLIEGHERSKRETEHSVGLLRKEVDAEKAQAEKDFDLARREAELTVRENAVDEQVAKLGEKLEFVTKTLQAQKQEIFDLVKQLIDNLPNMNVAIGAGSARPQAGDDD